MLDDEVATNPMSDVKDQISLRYEKLELENKLAEMTKSILNFKNAYGSQSLSSPRSEQLYNNAGRS